MICQTLAVSSTAISSNCLFPSSNPPYPASNDMTHLLANADLDIPNSILMFSHSVNVLSKFGDSAEDSGSGDEESTSEEGRLQTAVDLTSAKDPFFGEEMQVL